MNSRIQSLVNQFLKLLEKNADEKYRQGSVMSTPSKLEVIGIRVPVLRQIAKDWLRENKEMDAVDFVALLRALWKKPIFEMKSLGLELLYANKKALKNFDWQTLEVWLSDVDNWVHCDFLSCNIFGLLVKQNQSHLKRLKKYLKKSGKWFQRTGIVSTLQLIRAKKIESNEVLSMIDQIVDNQDAMIQKAISWVLRELVRAGSGQEVEKYLRRNQSRLAKYVIREVNNKLRTGLKSGKKLKKTGDLI